MSTMTTHPETAIDAPAGVPWIDLTREFDAPPEKVFRVGRHGAHDAPRSLSMRSVEESMSSRTWSSRRYRSSACCR